MLVGVVVVSAVSSESQPSQTRHFADTDTTQKARAHYRTRTYTVQYNYTVQPSAMQ